MGYRFEWVLLSRLNVYKNMIFFHFFFKKDKAWPIITNIHTHRQTLDRLPGSAVNCIHPTAR